MQREEKQLDMLLEASLLRLNDLKRAIGSMLQKIGKVCDFVVCGFRFKFNFQFLETEHETINWPTFLDNFAIISGHVNIH